MIDWASTVAVVVPSPASSLTFEATSLTSCAPMFWNGSSSSTSRATLTPSLVMWGAPNFFSMITLRPFGRGHFHGIGQSVDAFLELFASLFILKFLSLLPWLLVVYIVEFMVRGGES